MLQELEEVFENYLEWDDMVENNKELEERIFELTKSNDILKRTLTELEEKIDDLQCSLAKFDAAMEESQSYMTDAFNVLKKVR